MAGAAELGSTGCYWRRLALYPANKPCYCLQDIYLYWDRLYPVEIVISTLTWSQGLHSSLIVTKGCGIDT